MSEIMYFTSGIAPEVTVNSYLDILPLDLNVLIFDKMCGCIIKATTLYSSGIFAKVFKLREFWDILHRLKFPDILPEVIPDKYRDVGCTDVGQWLNNYMQPSLCRYAAKCEIRDLDNILDRGYHIPFPFAIEVNIGDVTKMWSYDLRLFSMAMLASCGSNYAVNPYKFIRELKPPPRVVTTCYFIDDTYTFTVTFILDKKLYRWIIPIGINTLTNLYFALRIRDK